MTMRIKLDPSTTKANILYSDSFSLVYNENSVQLYGTGTDFCQTKTVAIADGNWHRITASINGTFCYIVVDDAQVTSDYTISEVTQSDDNQIVIGNFDGELDNVAIYLDFLLAYQTEGLVDNMKSCNSKKEEEHKTETTTGTNPAPGTTTGQVTDQENKRSGAGKFAEISIFVIVIVASVLFL